MLVGLRKLGRWQYASGRKWRETAGRGSKIGGRADAKDMWAAVRRLTGRQQDTAGVDGITAESLNDYYAAISTDSDYNSPVPQQPDISIQP